MKFRDFEFPSNPSFLEIGTSTNVHSEPIFNMNSRVQNVSVNPVTVKGRGELYGEDAEDSCSYLQHMLRLKLPGLLFLPSSVSFNAFLTEFTFSRQADRRGISYSFVFTENCNGRHESREFHHTVALESDNAFTIANRCGVSVSDIMKNNVLKRPLIL